MTVTPARRVLPRLAALSGAAWVALGTILLGASGYAVLTVTTSVVSPEDYAALASLYLLVAVIGPGVFIAVEQETSRLVSRAHALGQGTRQVVGQVGRLVGIMLAVTLVGLAALSPLVLDAVFDGHVGLLVALVASVIGYAALHVARGLFAGQRRLRGYAACVGGEGLVRLVPCLALVALGVSSPEPYGLALGLSPVLAVLATGPWLRVGADGPGVPGRELASAVGWLMAAWLLSLALANVGPVVVKALLAGEPARVPLFVLFSLQAILLPALSRSAARRDLPRLRRAVRQALLGTGALGVLAVATTAPVGLWLLREFFGDRADVSAATLTGLALGTVAAMIIQVLQPALVAVTGHQLVAWAWLAGTAGFAAAFALPVDPVVAATVAQVVGTVVTALILGLSLRRHLRREVLS